MIATTNDGKFEELRDMLAIDGVEYTRPEGYMRTLLSDVEENRKSYLENAIIKAKICFARCPIIADDSGFELKAMPTYPGLKSARVIGESKSGEEKVEHILGVLEHFSKMPSEQEYFTRDARFICSLVYINNFYPTTPIVSTGFSYGEITEKPIGPITDALPYDSIFFHKSLETTFANVSKEEKNKVSHRGMACREMVRNLTTIKWALER